MKKGLSKGVKITISVIVALVAMVGSFFLGYFVKDKTIPKELENIEYILSMYKKYYYEEESSDVIVDMFADALLDQYSDYYSKEEMELIHNANKGGREGSGLSYNTYDYTVSSVTWNSISDRAGVEIGGVIRGFKYNSDNFVLVTPPSEGGDGSLQVMLEEIPDNTEFTLLIEYDGVTKEHIIQRAPYTETFVRYYTNEFEYGFREINGEMQFVKIGENTRYDLQGRSDVAVIDYNGFSALNDGLYGSAGQIECALNQFKIDNKNDLILDLRNNGGGFMTILEEVSSHFIGAEQNSKQVVSVARYKDNKTEEYSSHKVTYHNYGFESITVLANSGTASASEVLIGAMLDYDYQDKVSVVLEGYYYKWANFDEDKIEIAVDYRTYGKGIMQTTYENFLTGEAIKLTTAKIFWPVSNISIHDVGVTTNLNQELNFRKTKIFNESDKGAVYDAVGLSK